MSTGLRRVTAEHVVELRAASLDELIAQMEQLRARDLDAVAWVLRIDGRWPRTLLLGNLRLRRLLATAASGHRPDLALRSFLRDLEQPVIVSAGAEPERRAIVEDGSAWVPVDELDDRPLAAPRPGLPRRGDLLGGRRRPPVGPTQYPVPTDAPSVAPSGALRRTPHLVAPTIVRPGENVLIEVFCDEQHAQPGEVVQPVEVPVDAHAEDVVVDVWLSGSAHFEFERTVKELRLTRAPGRSPSVYFEATVRLHAEAGTGWLTALFHHLGRPAGQVSRSVAVADRAETLPGEPAPVIVVRPEDVPADVSVRITTRDKHSGLFDCRVDAPALGVSRAPTPWQLPGAAPALVDGYLRGFQEEADDRARRSRLLGSGIELWDACPENFKQAVRALADRGRRGSMLVVTDEPTFPWELVVPDTPADHVALGVRHALGRWVTTAGVAPEQAVAVTPSFVFAPRYASPLPRSRDEAEFVCTRLDGEEITPGTFGSLDDAFARGRDVALLHLICHGQRSEAQPQSIALEDGATLQSNQIAAMEFLAPEMRRLRPLVFLNACEVGRAQPALFGVSGFAATFIRVGARGVIAPLWSVADDIAHEFAVAFYGAVLDRPDVPFAEHVADLRGRGYQDGGADSWAAYCFYGDPLASVHRATGTPSS